LKTLDEYNRHRYTLYAKPIVIKTGVLCPNCGTEMEEENPGIVLTSLPPKKAVICPKCNKKGFMII